MLGQIKAKRATLSSSCHSGLADAMYEKQLDAARRTTPVCGSSVVALGDFLEDKTFCSSLFNIHISILREVGGSP